MLDSWRRRQAGLSAAAAICAAVALGACRRGEAPAAAPPVTVLGPEDIAVAEPCLLEAGPAISGVLQPRLAATVSAEVAGAVRKVLVESGEQVERGKLAVVLDDTSQRDGLIAARQALRSARNTLQVALQEEERSKRLAEAGGLAQRDLERAEAAVQTQRAQVADAQSRLVVARQELERTRVKVPFDGVVSARPASQGDIVQVGNALFTVVDPSTMRLEAQVPAEDLSHLRPGTPVDFHVTGWADRTFRGEIEYVQPTVDAATGQVRLDVAVPNRGGPLLGGLAARGRVVTASRRGLCAPLETVDFASARPTVLRLGEDDVVERVAVELGLRDEIAQRVELRSGAAPGTRLLRAAARETVAPGAKVTVRGPPAPREGQPPGAEPETRARTPRRP